MSKGLMVFIIVAVFLFVSGIASAQKGMYIEYILDSSNSMNEPLPGGETKIVAAKRVLCGLVDNLAVEVQDVNVGLRIYGANFKPSDTKKIACMDSILVVPISKINASVIKEKVMATNAAGYTPIAYSLELASKDFVKGEGNSNMIVLVSDGQETCGGDPVAVAKKLAEQGFAIKIYTIGFAVDEETRKQLEGVAQATGGKYFDAKDADQLQKSLEEIKDRSLEGYEAAGKAVDPSLWVADAPEIEPGEYKGTLAMHELKFYKVKVQKGQKVKATLVVKKTHFDARDYLGTPEIFQTFYIDLFDNNLADVASVAKLIEGNPEQPITFKAEWAADKSGWVYIAVAASRNQDAGGKPTSLDPLPAPSQYTLKVKVKGEAAEEAAPEVFAGYTAKETNGGAGFEKAETIKLREATRGDIYMKETKFFKMPVEGKKNLKVAAVVQKPYYVARNHLSIYEINMTYTLTVYDEDWAEIAHEDVTLGLNPAAARCLNVALNSGDNDEIYISLTASENHVNGDPRKPLGAAGKDYQARPTKFSILVTSAK